MKCNECREYEKCSRENNLTIKRKHCKKAKEKTELKECPICKAVPKLRYCCGEYFVSGENGDCPVCGTAFTEMHSSEERMTEAWNKRAAEMKPFMTNEDRIHSARGRELAEILYSIDGADYCRNYTECWKLLDEEGCIPEERCISCIENWLKRTVKEDNK